MRSFTPDRLLESGYEMKPEGKHCTTGKPRLSRQLRPPQGVNYTETDRHFRKPFSACHKNKHSLTSLALDRSRCADVQQERTSQEAAMGNASAAAQRANSAAAPGMCLHQNPIPFPLTVPRWALQCGHICTSAGHPAPMFLFPVACPPLPIHPQCKKPISLYCIFSPQNLADCYFFKQDTIQGKEQIHLY